jgi:hypothetical protein
MSDYTLPAWPFLITLSSGKGCILGRIATEDSYLSSSPSAWLLHKTRVRTRVRRDDGGGGGGGGRGVVE